MKAAETRAPESSALIRVTPHAIDLPTIAGLFMSVSLGPNGDMFVSDVCNSTAKRWHIRRGRATQTFTGHDSNINVVQFLPNGDAFATASDDVPC
ncbi:hypothetical protein FRC12_005886 [Ceratobasidium sp. 428]|nr:hypothetical protein FRC12_005886 [Ceratobasidium sp. 428]